MTIGDSNSNASILGVLQTTGVNEDAYTYTDHTHSIDAINNSYRENKITSIEDFEQEFQEKYKVKFEDFIEVLMKDYPELKI